MSEQTQSAIKLAEDILYLIYQSDVDVDACNEASSLISKYGAGEGILWGIHDLTEHGRMDGRFYDLKGLVVDFIRDIMRNKDYYLVCGLPIKKNMERVELE